MSSVSGSSQICGSGGYRFLDGAFQVFILPQLGAGISVSRLTTGETSSELRARCRPLSTYRHAPCRAVTPSSAGMAVR